MFLLVALKFISDLTFCMKVFMTNHLNLQLCLFVLCKSSFDVIDNEFGCAFRTKF